MIHRNVFHNGHIVPIEEARLSPGQAGLLSGWGLFTTMRVFRGEPFAFERHWRRLTKDAARTRIPFTFDPASVRTHLRELIHRNEVSDGTARIYAIYNKVGFWQSDEKLPEVDLLMYTSGMPPVREPLRLTIGPEGRHAASPLAGVKVTSWLVNVWHLQGAQQRGFDEIILLNERGEVAECTAANIFCVKKGTVLTPPLSSGALEGVTRSVLLEIAPLDGVPMEEASLRTEDLYSADEVFITSTNRNVIGIGEIEGHTFPSAPGPIVKKLEATFFRYMTDYVTQAAAQISVPR
jgi:branched-chain amino acid aminotransferase